MTSYVFRIFGSHDGVMLVTKENCNNNKSRNGAYPLPPKSMAIVP